MGRAVRSYQERVWVQVRTRKKSCVFWFCCTFPFCAWLSTSIRGKQLNNCNKSSSPSQFNSFSSKIACKWRQWFEWNIYIIFPLLLSWQFTKGPRKKLRSRTIITATMPKSFYPKPETCVSLSTLHISAAWAISFTILQNSWRTKIRKLFYSFFQGLPLSPVLQKPEVKFYFKFILIQSSGSNCPKEELLHRFTFNSWVSSLTRYWTQAPPKHKNLQHFEITFQLHFTNLEVYLEDTMFSMKRNSSSWILLLCIKRWLKTLTVMSNWPTAML